MTYGNAGYTCVAAVRTAGTQAGFFCAKTVAASMRKAPPTSPRGCSPPCRQALQQLFADDSRALSALLFCYDWQQAADREALAAACGLLTSTAVSGECKAW
jgi:hypothetical protein